MKNISKDRFSLLFIILVGLFFSCTAEFNNLNDPFNNEAGDSNAYLSDIILSDVTLSPDFYQTITEYTAVVVYETASITVTPTAAGTNSTITVNGTIVASGQPSNEIDLVVGDNEISILVTAEDGTTTETYTVTVTRNIELNHNANLSNLTISEGTLSPVFDSDQQHYSRRYDSKSAVSSVTVTPTAEESSASITVNSVTVTSGQASAAITINEGSNIINVTVTAEDIFTTKTYVINLCKAKIDLPKTGQTTCYDAEGLVIACNETGQDGDLQTGIEWPDPRFTDNGNTVTDNLTGLMWVKDANLMVTNNIGFDNDGTEDDGLVTWFHALDYAVWLSDESYEGFSDWRLPNNRELRSLVDYQYLLPSLPQGHPFTSVQNSYYWTSTTYYYDTSTPRAWGVHMRSGTLLYIGKSFTRYVWAVRTVQTGTIDLPKTGQTQVHAAGDDGDLEMGIEWPDPRFTDNGNGTVTDNLTGLMWEQTPSAVQEFWTDALATANGKTIGGYSDWRLPNINELESLIDIEAAPTLPEDHPFDLGTSRYFWTSTTYLNNTADAWSVSFDTGLIASFIKTNTRRIWAVRSGE